MPISSMMPRRREMTLTVDSDFVRNIDYDAATKAVNEVLSMMARKQKLSYNLRFLRDRLRIAPIDTVKKLAAHLLRG